MALISRRTLRVPLHMKTFQIVVICIASIWILLLLGVRNTRIKENDPLHQVIRQFGFYKESESASVASYQERPCSKIVPCIVWMLWEQGWDVAPPLQAVCRESWILRNPNYEIRALNLSEAERLINRSELYPDEAWKTCRRQHMADIIRYELLARYGGIWADATCHCNEPLDNWIDTVLAPQNFFVFERHDGSVTELTRPWISTWFIASTKDSPQLKLWVSAVRESWKKKPYPSELLGYFWPNRLYTQLYHNRSDFRKYHHNMYHIDAGGPHCYYRDLKMPVVYKLKVCGPIKERIIESYLNGTYKV